MLARDVQPEELRVECGHVEAVGVGPRASVACEPATAAGRPPIRALARPVEELEPVRLALLHAGVRKRPRDRVACTRRVEPELRRGGGCVRADEKTEGCCEGGAEAESGSHGLPLVCAIVDVTETAARSFNRQTCRRP